jgi:hypothetical protein
MVTGTRRHSAALTASLLRVTSGKLYNPVRSLHPRPASTINPRPDPCGDDPLLMRGVRIRVLALWDIRLRPGARRSGPSGTPGGAEEAEGIESRGIDAHIEDVFAVNRDRPPAEQRSHLAGSERQGLRRGPVGEQLSPIASSPCPGRTQPRYATENEWCQKRRSHPIPSASCRRSGRWGPLSAESLSSCTSSRHP